MEFGQDKCAYLSIIKGKIVDAKSPLIMNGLVINPVENGQCYKYLGQDENISYVWTVNKSRVQKEYFKRLKKVWSSELSVFNKTIAHNAIALPVPTPIFGILDWTVEDIKAIDIKTRKILSLTGNFNINSDVDKLYSTRKLNGRGLIKPVQEAFDSRIVSLRQHLTHCHTRNLLMSEVYHQTSCNILRVGKELLDSYDINENIEMSPRVIGQIYLQEAIKEKEKLYSEKVMHGYIRRKLDKDVKIDRAVSLSWTQDKYITSHFESVASAIQEQELMIKYLINKREKDSGKKVTCDS